MRCGEDLADPMSESLSLSSDDSGDEGSSNNSDLILEDIKPTTARPGAYYALICVTLLNLLNYTDRYIPAALKEEIKAAFNYTSDSGLTDAETGYQALVFLLVYMVCSPVFGTLSDHGVSRKMLIIFGVVCWSIASASAFWAYSFPTFLLCRAFVGVGEASFVVITPSLLSDLFPPDSRNAALTFFYIAIPVGAALGYILGAVLGHNFGWRMAFLATGLPGILVAIGVFFIQDPGRGVFEQTPEETPEEQGIFRSWINALALFWRTRIYRIVILGGILNTFGLGAMADWLPAHITRSIPEAGVQKAGLITGGASVIGGIAGTLLGGLIAEKLKSWGGIRNPYMFVSSVGTLIGCSLACVAIFIHEIYVVGVLLVIAQIFLWMYSGPINAVLVNCVPSHVRTRAFGFQMVLIHLFGDAISPTIVGAISDIPSVGLQWAVLLLPVTMFIGGLVYLLGWYFYPEEGEQVEAFAPVSEEEEISSIDSSDNESHNLDTITKFVDSQKARDKELSDFSLETD